jgi:Zn-dependent M16 (insulinase) family peptidase
VGGVEVLTHDLATNGILYLDLAFDLSVVPQDLMPYVPLFSAALLQTGTKDLDFVGLSQRIGRSTGGIHPARFVSSTVAGGTAARLILRGKAVPEKFEELLAILSDVLLTARLDNKERIGQMVLEAKAGFESRLSGMGNGLMVSRLNGSWRESDWLSEQLGGVSYLFFLRKLVKEVADDFDGVAAKLDRIRDLLIGRAPLIANVTSDRELWNGARPAFASFLSGLPAGQGGAAGWTASLGGKSEGFTYPGKVNFVAKGANLFDLGYTHSGAIAVALRHLQTTWLWDKVRVQGGAYGGGASYDFLTGSFAYSSYRDPNLLETLKVYDGTAAFLRQPLSQEELTRSIIGTIGGIDRYMLPDAKGYTGLVRHLIGDTEEDRQRRREQVLGANLADFKAIADVLDAVAEKGQVAVLGSESAITQANAEKGGFLAVTKVL